MRTYLNVSFEEKDEAKRLGARWDSEVRRWYVPDKVDVAPFSRWLPAPVASGSVMLGPVYLRRSAERCYKCSAVSEVFCLGASTVREALPDDDGEVYVHEEDNLPGLVNIMNLAELDERLVNALLKQAPRYKLDPSQMQSSRVWMNHCQHCGAKLGDFYMHCEPEGAFCPLYPEQSGIVDTLLFEQGEFAFVGDTSVVG